jgi:hypothetical protein
VSQLSPDLGVKSSNIEVNATVVSSMKFKKINSLLLQRLMTYTLQYEFLKKNRIYVNQLRLR